MFSASLEFEGVIRVEGELLRCVYFILTWGRNTDETNSISPRRQYIMFSTKDPPAVQRIPWPSQDDEEFEEVGESGQASRTLSNHHTWILNDEELPWLVSANGEYFFSPPFNILANFFLSFCCTNDLLSGLRCRNMDNF